MFAATVAMKSLGEFTTFGEAFEAFYNETMTLMDRKELCWQVLETACWIEHPVELITKTVTISLMFYEVRDLAANLGLTKDSKLVQPLPIVNSEAVEKFFLSAALELSFA